MLTFAAARDRNEVVMEAATEIREDADERGRDGR